MSRANAVMGAENVMVRVSLLCKKPMEVEPRPFGDVVVRYEFVTNAVPNDGV